MATPPTPIYTTDHLVDVFGAHCAGTRRCSCCGRFTVYRVQYAAGLPVYLCSTCDVEKAG